MSVWKRNAVVVAIVLFVGAAVYLNWSYNNQAEQTGEEPGRVLGEASLVNAQEEGQDGGASAQPNASASPAPSGTAQMESDQTGYFASARLNRQQARDNALALLQQAAADASADQALIDEANASIQTMADDTLSEAQVENLVTAKGYGDCVCFIGEDGVNLVVSSTDQGLSETDIAKIVEIVREETGLSADKIKIIEAKP